VKDCDGKKNRKMEKNNELFEWKPSIFELENEDETGTALVRST